jgi:NTP pyrophosphatase (non-canonical NTP hydrolase)
MTLENRETAGSLAAQIADQLTAMDGLDRNDKYTQMMRVTKLAEEVGEVAEALIAYQNVNPRKPAGPLAAVIKELCDVALTAKVSIENFGFDAEAELEGRERAILGRLKDAATTKRPTCICLPMFPGEHSDHCPVSGWKR